MFLEYLHTENINASNYCVGTYLSLTQEDLVFRIEILWYHWQSLDESETGCSSPSVLSKSLYHVSITDMDDYQGEFRKLLLLGKEPPVVNWKSKRVRTRIQMINRPHTAVFICLCTRHRSSKYNREEGRDKRGRSKRLTIQVTHSSVVLVFNEHITKFDLCPVHVLTGDHKSGKATTAFNLPMGENIADLRWQ